MNKKVLIIEDDPTTQRLYAHIFREHFPEVELDIACSVRKATEHLQNNDYDLYIVDLMLSDDTSGSIMINTYYRPMIVISGIEVNNKLHSVEYLQKPIRTNELVSLVKKLIYK